MVAALFCRLLPPWVPSGRFSWGRGLFFPCSRGSLGLFEVSILLPALASSGGGFSGSGKLWGEWFPKMRFSKYGYIFSHSILSRAVRGQFSWEGWCLPRGFSHLERFPRRLLCLCPWSRVCWVRHHLRFLVARAFEARRWGGRRAKCPAQE